MEQSELQKPISQLFKVLKSHFFLCELFSEGCSTDQTVFCLLKKNKISIIIMNNFQIFSFFNLAGKIPGILSVRENI